MEKVKITFELSKDYISSVMTILELTPKEPANREKLLAAMDSITVDADDDEALGDDTREIKIAFALLAIGKTAEKLDLEEKN